MAREKLKFITGEPAALLPGRIVVIADLHLGAEYEMRKAGMAIPSQTTRLLKSTLELGKNARARKIIILGDVKHMVPGLTFQEKREVPYFLNALNREFDVEVVLGNHDGGIERLVPKIKFHPSSGILVGDIYLSHGHTNPSTGFLRASHVLVGHNHPLIEFRDRLGYVWRERVWVRAELDVKAVQKFGSIDGRAEPNVQLPELIVMPAYNDISGGRPLNSPEDDKVFMGPLARAAKSKDAKIYLLDGTYLGRLSAL